MPEIRALIYMYEWQERLFFYSVVSVIFTTLFSWFNVNSVCIMLMVVSRFLHLPIPLLKTAFSNRLFLAFLAYFLIGGAGFLYARNIGNQADCVSKEATLIAVALVFSLPDSLSETSYRRLLNWYHFLLVAASIYCLAFAVQNFRSTGDSSVFFYHLLTRPISQNAVFYSVFIVFGLLFLLAPGGNPFAGSLTPAAATLTPVPATSTSPGNSTPVPGTSTPVPATSTPTFRRLYRFALAAFYLAMIVLLNSKLMLVIGLLILLNALFRKYSFRTSLRPLLAISSMLIVLICLLGMTDNPVSRRYRELAAGDLAVVRQERFDPGMYFNALQLRLLEWRFGYEILNAHHAWVTGVSPGDSQDLLDAKYVATNMYIGNPAEGPHRKDRGFLGYNFHNQYLETLVRSGLIGLASLIAIFVLLIAEARRLGRREGWFIVLTLVVFFIPEAPLTLQHGVFLFCFFPLLMPYSRKNAG